MASEVDKTRSLRSLHSFNWSTHPAKIRKAAMQHLFSETRNTPSSPGLPMFPYSVERTDRKTTALACESSSTSTSMVGVKSKPTKSFRGIWRCVEERKKRAKSRREDGLSRGR